MFILGTGLLNQHKILVEFLVLVILGRSQKSTHQDLVQDLGRNSCTILVQDLGKTKTRSCAGPVPSLYMADCERVLAGRTYARVLLNTLIRFDSIRVKLIRWNYNNKID